MSAVIEKLEKLQKDIVVNHLLVSNGRDEKVLDVVSRMPRCDFVEDSLKSLANSDSPLFYSKDRFLLDMSTVASMIEFGKFQSSDMVLVIGAGIGYSACLLSQFVSRVIALEEDETLVNLARKNIERLKISNVELQVGNISNFSLVHPFNRIFFDGAFSEVRTDLAILLQNKVDLVGIQRKSNLSMIINVHKIDNRFVSFYGRHTPTPYLKGFEETEKFSF